MFEQIIKKAIEGGYDILPPFFYSNFGEVIPKGNIPELTFYSYVLDRLFWQALGKACGWKDSCVHAYDDKGKYVFMPEWKHYALQFYEINLTERWDKYEFS